MHQALIVAAAKLLALALALVLALELLHVFEQLTLKLAVGSRQAGCQPPVQAGSCNWQQRLSNTARRRSWNLGCRESCRHKLTGLLQRCQ